MIKYIFKLLAFMLVLMANVYSGFSQARDTLKLSITQVKKLPPDTVYHFTSRVDTLALQPIIADTSKMVKDVNPQDLEASRYMIRLLGSVRVNSYYDFNGMTSTEGFLPYDIPIGEDKVDGLSSTYIGARQSRFGLEGKANTKVGSIRTYIEVDFVSETNSMLRLRQAYVEWNYFRIGHSWTTFMDNTSLPNTVDFEGPNSALSKRHGVVRYERKFFTNSVIGASVESPKSDYFNPQDSLIANKSKQKNFDLAARYKHLTPWGHFLFATIYRRISYLNNYKMEMLLGWGFLGSAIVKPNLKNSVFMQYSIGKAISNYNVGFYNRQLDAVYDVNTNDMYTKLIHGGFVSINHFLNDKWTFALTSGLTFMNNYSFESHDAFASSQYIAVTSFYSPLETIKIGCELTYGTRVNKDGQSGNATRISMLGSFSF